MKLDIALRNERFRFLGKTEKMAEESIKKQEKILRKEKLFR